MKDVHVHFLHGKAGGYTMDFFNRFISGAQQVHLNEIYLLEHTHQFCEFSDVYTSVKNYNSFQRNWIDGWGFDHPKQKELWQKTDINAVYRRYYDIMFELCESDFFGGVAHPDSIKCFGYAPTYDLSPAYNKLASLLNKHNMYAENSGGLRLNYSPDLELGLNQKLLKILKENHTHICAASDAHKQSDVGANIRELERMLELCQNI